MNNLRKLIPMSIALAALLFSHLALTDIAHIVQYLHTCLQRIHF